jgi:hypothetical protein
MEATDSFKTLLIIYHITRSFMPQDRNLIYRYMFLSIECGIVDVWRDNHVTNFHTNIYCRYNGHADELQLEYLKLAGCRSQVADRLQVQSQSQNQIYVTTDGQSASLS